MYAGKNHYSSKYAEAARRERAGVDEVARRAAIDRLSRPLPRDTASGLPYSDAAELNRAPAADPKELQNDSDPIQSAAFPPGWRMIAGSLVPAH